MIDKVTLYELAGPASFARGENYFRDGRVALSRRDANGFEGRAEGTASYRLWLRDDPDEVRWDCDCPMAAQGNFCKHLVAAGLAWLAGAATGEPQPPQPREDTLLVRLKEQPAERLAEWLHGAAMNDPALARRLRLQLADDPDEVKRALSAMLTARGFLDYRRSLDYAVQLEAPLDLLTDMLASDPDRCLALTEYALSRLLRVLARADDSAGGIGDRIGEFAELHARAVAAAGVDGKQLAKSLFQLKKKDDWGLFPLAAYWDALGAAGQGAYAGRVRREYAALPSVPAGPASAHWVSEYPVRSRYEELVRMEGDFDALIELLARGLSSGHGYQRIVAACREHGRDALALQWAERALKADPRFPGTRTMAAEEYRKAGLDEEARELLLAELVERPDPQAWAGLRKAAGEHHWPALREQALAGLAAREREILDGPCDATVRIRLLRLDGDTDAARALAGAHAAHPDELDALAEDVAGTHPAQAAAFLRRAISARLEHADARDYAAIVPRIRRAADLDAGPDTEAWLQEIRRRYRPRYKLMRLMNEAGLG
ncbi:MAG TPA: SWIM zinc finger family protein [Gammaproteobacteria bacterium]|nr:SWIM zinc finger family protein [Gammaproteobacteria bacterium]